MRTGSSWQGARGTPGAKPGAARKRDGEEAGGLRQGGCLDTGDARTWEMLRHGTLEMGAQGKELPGCCLALPWQERC